MSKKKKEKKAVDLKEVKNGKAEQLEKEKQVAAVNNQLKANVINLFRQAILDRMSGIYHINTAYDFERSGIEPILAYQLVDSFIAQIKMDIKQSRYPNIEIRRLFYNQVCDLFLGKAEPPRKVETPKPAPKTEPKKEVPEEEASGNEWK